MISFFGSSRRCRNSRAGHRFGLSERVQRLAMDFQDALVAAGKSRGTERRVALRQADLILEQLRIWLRYARDMELFSISQYEHAARCWLKLDGCWVVGSSRLRLDWERVIDRLALRGGSWNNNAENARVAERNRNNPDNNWNNNVGFRVVCVQISACQKIVQFKDWQRGRNSGPASRLG